MWMRFPKFASHWTASSSARWSLVKPPSSYVRGHESTEWDIVWVSATRAQVLRVCWSLPSLSTGATMSRLCSMETIQQRPLLSRKVKAWLSDCGVIHSVDIDHQSRHPAFPPRTSDVSWFFSVATVAFFSGVNFVDISGKSLVWISLSKVLFQTAEHAISLVIFSSVSTLKLKFRWLLKLHFLLTFCYFWLSIFHWLSHSSVQLPGVRARLSGPEILGWHTKGGHQSQY